QGSTTRPDVVRPRPRGRHGEAGCVTALDSTVLHLIVRDVHDQTCASHQPADRRPRTERISPLSPARADSPTLLGRLMRRMVSRAGQAAVTLACYPAGV